MLVVFDLPVTEVEQRKKASEFRKYLLEEGYLMIQFSVYARSVVSHNRMETQLRRLKQNMPPEGNVRALYVTQAQWERAFIMHGSPIADQLAEKIPEQMQLW